MRPERVAALFRDWSTPFFAATIAHLPPVMFTADEAMALFVGGEMVKQFTDALLVSPMLTALLKIRTVLPRERQDDVERLAQAVAIEGRPRAADGLDQRVLLPLPQAIVARRVLRLGYRARPRAAYVRRGTEWHVLSA